MLNSNPIVVKDLTDYLTKGNVSTLPNPIEEPKKGYMSYALRDITRSLCNTSCFSVKSNDGFFVVERENTNGFSIEFFDKNGKRLEYLKVGNTNSVDIDIPGRGTAYLKDYTDANRTIQSTGDIDPQYIIREKVIQKIRSDVQDMKTANPVQIRLISDYLNPTGVTTKPNPPVSVETSCASKSLDTNGYMTFGAYEVNKDFWYGQDKFSAKDGCFKISTNGRSQIRIEFFDKDGKRTSYLDTNGDSQFKIEVPGFTMDTNGRNQIKTSGSGYDAYAIYDHATTIFDAVWKDIQAMNGADPVKVKPIHAYLSIRGNTTPSVPTTPATPVVNGYMEYALKDVKKTVNTSTNFSVVAKDGSFHANQNTSTNFQITFFNTDGSVKESLVYNTTTNYKVEIPGRGYYVKNTSTNYDFDGDFDPATIDAAVEQIRADVAAMKDGNPIKVKYISQYLK